jgi:hypothetical protein
VAITTTYQEKVPSHLSYPLGLELLATELGQIPQADELSVCFHAHSGRATEIEHKRQNGEYYPAMEARFNHYRIPYSECKDMKELYGPKWTITVYAVSRKNRTIARTLLCKQAIPAVAIWLRSPRSETWLEGRKQITVYFNEKDQAVIIEADHAG